MRKHQVFIIWSNPLFHEAIRFLLRHPDINIVGDASDLNEANRQIAEIHPDMVIIETPGESNEPNDETFFILQTGPKVIRLSLADNELNLYQRQDRTIDRPEDLLNLILSERSEDPSKHADHE